jgi:hypothetical protein
MHVQMQTCATRNPVDLKIKSPSPMSVISSVTLYYEECEWCNFIKPRVPHTAHVVNKLKINDLV